MEGAERNGKLSQRISGPARKSARDVEAYPINRHPASLQHQPGLTPHASPAHWPRLPPAITLLCIGSASVERRRPAAALRRYRPGDNQLLHRGEEGLSGNSVHV